MRPLTLASAISAILSGAASAQAPPVSDTGVQLDEVIVTAQKRTENLQNVPVSIQALDSEKLANLQVSSFDDYLKYLPSLSSQSYGPGQSQLYVRGVTNGGDGLQVGSQPLVGVYLDEQPVTTVYNNLDVHIHDIARVEALSGPQGTLFGSSSMAGTVRIITNKPSSARFEAGYAVTADTVTAGRLGGTAEGFVNVPISDRMAIRLVGFGSREGGYINNVPGPAQTYPTSGITRSNAGLTKSRYNNVDTYGARAALRINLNDNWTITPSAMAQHQKADGQFGFAPGLGDLNVARYNPERSEDRWWQAALTVEGKVSNFDVVYAGGYIRRTFDNVADYSDYSYFYDASYVGGSTPTYYGDKFRDDAGELISPAQTTVSRSLFNKQSHEIRVSSPQDARLRAVLGLFYQRQVAYPRDEYRVANLAAQYSVTGQPGVFYLNAQDRVDKDQAVFTELSYDVTDRLTLTGGLRYFKYRNTVFGFFGFNGLPDFNGNVNASGEILCGAPPDPGNAQRPCINIDSLASGNGETYKANFTYKFSDERLLYATWSTGFRPGGVNRVQARPPYTPDYLSNIEVGWKTTWLDRRLRLNGAIFFERWKDAQFGITGANGITEIINAGRSEIRGVEADAQWAVTHDLMLSASGTWLDTELKTDACNVNVSPCPSGEVLAPAGSRLPVSPKFKANLIARYQFQVGGFDAHLQGATVTQTSVLPTLEVAFAQALGSQPAYSTFDFAAGIERGSWSAELYVNNAFDRRGEQSRTSGCAPDVCTTFYAYPVRPRSIGLTFSQKF